MVINTNNKHDLPNWYLGNEELYNSDTAIPSFGQYVTWRAFIGAEHEGERVGVYVAYRDLNDPNNWSLFNRETGRLVIEDGHVYYWRRENTEKWISVQFKLDGTNEFTNAEQAHWINN